MAVKFTKEHIAALDCAIREKQANPAMEIFTQNIVVNDAVPVVTLTDATAAVTAAVGGDAKSGDSSALQSQIPAGGFSLEQLIKARDHALANL